MKFLRVLFVSLFFPVSAALAQTPTAAPTATASIVPTPLACASAQACVDSALPTAIANCVAGSLTCDSAKADKLAVSAGQLASRAVLSKNCAKKKFRSSCNLCYQLAKQPLRNRFDGKLFHGLLANAISLIEAERKQVCSALSGSRR